MRKHLKNYFIPHEGNDHKPHSLRKASILSILTIAILFELGFLSTIFSPFAVNFKNNLAAVLPGILVSVTNEEREERNLEKLEINPLLVEAAQLKADDMAEREFFAHVNPDGEQPWVYLKSVGYKYESAGENLAVNFVDSKDVHDAWMESPTHKANIIQKKFTEIGIATSRGRYKGKEVVFVVQFFGKPKEVTNTTQFAVNDSEKASKVLASREFESGSKVLGVQTGELGEKISEESNVIKKVETSPRSIVKFVTFILLGLVILALLLKIFIKMHIQHKGLIFSGIFTVLIIIAFLLLNERIASYFGEINIVS
jgi:membrane protein CcdC involved in cytochrome C biogenesis